MHDAIDNIYACTMCYSVAYVQLVLHDFVHEGSSCIFRISK